MSERKVHYWAHIRRAPQCGVRSSNVLATTICPDDVTCQRCCRYLDWKAEWEVQRWSEYQKMRKESR